MRRIVFNGKLFLVVVISIIVLLAILKFDDVTTNITKEQAIGKVRTQTEVAEYFKRVPQVKISVNGGENGKYLIQVYEIKDGHTATFNWYRVDKITGEVEKEL